MYLNKSTIHKERRTVGVTHSLTSLCQQVEDMPISVAAPNKSYVEPKSHVELATLYHYNRRVTSGSPSSPCIGKNKIDSKILFFIFLRLYLRCWLSQWEFPAIKEVFNLIITNKMPSILGVHVKIRAEIAPFSIDFLCAVSNVDTEFLTITSIYGVNSGSYCV